MSKHDKKCDTVAEWDIKTEWLSQIITLLESG